MLNRSFIISLFFIISVFAQSYRIEGYVFDKENDKVLTGANISLTESSLGAISDKEGKYFFSVPQKGRYTLNIFYVGYQPVKKTIIVLNEKTTVNFKMEPLILEGQTIEVTETRAKRGETPVAFYNMSSEEIQNEYTASDIPMMLNVMPNTFSYSVTGDELGYSFLKIRGFDQKRIGVMINGIPLNDPEDHQVYWVDMPDLAESTQDIQVQRGVGSSMYGSSTIGGSVNIVTDALNQKKGIHIQFLGGSFNTRKFAFKYNSGMVDNTYLFNARFSKITSEGYRKNSGSELWSYYISAARYDENRVTRFNLYGGPEVTHPDWDGLHEDDMKEDRTQKYSTYKNDVDHFNQPHYELINEWFISDKMRWKNTLYYVRGEGFYENLKTKAKLIDYGMMPFETLDPNLFGEDAFDYYEISGDTVLAKNDDEKFTIERTDLVRRKWVKKNQYGWISQLNMNIPESAFNVGFSGYLFDSEHFGRVLWAKNMQSLYNPDQRYYQYHGDKKVLSAFINNIYYYNKNITIMSNLLYEYKSRGLAQKAIANFSGSNVNQLEVDYHFFSPRLGATYTFDAKWSVFTNLSYAKREPSDDDLYDTWQGPDDLGVSPLFAKSDTVRSAGKIEKIKWEDPLVKPEEVLDLELGLNYNSEYTTASLNFYRMDFRNEIVPFGMINDDGAPVKGNAGSTIHQGIELAVKTKLWRYFSVNGNFSYSENYFAEFFYKEIDWETGKVAKEVDMEGNTIAGFPDMVGNIQAVFKYRRFYSSLTGQYVGKQYLDNTQNEDRIIDPYFTLRLVTSYKLKGYLGFPALKFTLKINNLLNEIYETAGYYYGGNYYWPAAGRSYYAGVMFEF
jgi:iron complex outermembrane receptor protein